MGHHEFSFAVMPHVGSWCDAGVVAQSFAFNSPLLWTRGDATRLGNEYSFAGVESADLVLDTIKKAEDSDEVVVRLYETHGARGTTSLRVDVPFTRAVRCNILEDEGEELTVNNGVIEVPYTPFQIIGIKLK
jgi:alpha-mannosidase